MPREARNCVSVKPRCGNEPLANGRFGPFPPSILTHLCESAAALPQVHFEPKDAI